MAKKLIKEEIYLATDTGMTPNQKEYQIVYIDPDKSENTFSLKDKFKEYNMEYLPYYKYFKYNPEIQNDLKRRHITWGWVIWNGKSDPVWQSIKKFEQDVNSFEQPSGENPRTQEDVHNSMPKIVQEMLDDIQEVKNLPNKKGISEETQKRIEDFENMLVNELGNEDTKKFIQSLIQYRAELHKHNIYNLGWTNMMLAFWTTGGKATEVRPLGEWEEMGYTLGENPTPIGLIGRGCKYIRYSKEQKARKIEDYCKDKGVDSIEELPASSKYDLYHRVLRGRKLPGTEYNFNYIGYDKSDMVAGSNAEVEPEEPEDNWWWNKASENEKDTALTKALIKFIESKEGGCIKVNIENSQQGLGGARGNATSGGVINLINDGHVMFPTLVHEALHQYRHWAFASANNPMLAKFYDRNASRDIREEEAELCACFVVSRWGYDIQSHLNYLDNWGLNKNNCKAVFDKISEIATFIENAVTENLGDKYKQ